MTYKQISKLLNDAINKNAIGENLTIAEDLSNVIDLGLAIADLDEKSLLDFSESIAVGVARNYFETKALAITDYGLFIDAQEFGGAVQRLKMSMDNFEAEDNVVYTLQNGVDYMDTKFRSVDVDVKVYTKTSGYDVVWSIPRQQFKQMFKSADEVASYIGMIEQTVKNKTVFMRNNLAKRVLNSIMQNAIEGNRKIDLVTTFNATHGEDEQTTTALCLNNPQFLRWAIMVITLTADRMKEVNKKYNDGTIETFMNEEDIRLTMLAEFDRAVSFNMESDTYHLDKVGTGRKYAIAPYWQNSSADLLPTLGKTAELVVGEDETAETYSNIVAVVYDKYAGFITQKLNDYVTSNYIAKGDYDNFFLHVANNYAIDTRNSAVVFTLN